MFIRFILISSLVLRSAILVSCRCRSQPGDPNFPTKIEWTAFNKTVSGRLLAVRPSAEACDELHCTEAQWASAVFRSMIPGQMNKYNWEQDYGAVPPQLCLHNGTTCDQGDVPLYAVNATEVEHIQAGIRFACKHDLRLVVKSSGDDDLGRSTAKNSLMIWTHYFQDIVFTDSFVLDGKNLGSAVTVGSGVTIQTIYLAAEKVGKIVVGCTKAATVALGGGYIQGGGHSAFSPLFGLAADNALQFEVILASGELVTANDKSNSELFWALRGGGAGSWGVITSVTVKTYPTFNALLYETVLTIPSTSLVGAVMSSHARHVFDWEPAGHFYELALLPNSDAVFFGLSTYFPNAEEEEAVTLMAPFFEEVFALGLTVESNSTTVGMGNELVYASDDVAGGFLVMGSRLVPAAAYRKAPEVIGQAHEELVQSGFFIVASVIGGGKLAENANISSAVHPAWRVAKNHLIAAIFFNETTSPADVEALRESLTNYAVPILANATGVNNSGAYSNEADLREPDFQVTFFGENYARLSDIKAKYDPNDLFIVGAGVGSERWDADGLCTVHT